MVERIAAGGWHAVNLDATVIAEAPRIAPHVPAMRENLARTLALPGEAVGVKGKTNEGLGPLGEGLAIAALAVTLLERDE